MREMITQLKNIAHVRRMARSLRYRMGSYREPEAALLPFLVNPSRLSIDVGGHYGSYTHLLLDCGGPVLVIEANPANADLIARMYGQRAKVLQAAASKQSGRVTLRIPRDSGTATIEQENQLNMRDMREIEVNMITLDEVAREPVGFIKIDVEGHELGVLQGADRILREDQPTILVEAEERHRHNAVQTVCDFLTERGYQGFMLKRGRLTPIRHFDLKRDQFFKEEKLDLLDMGTHTSRYINNFIFFN